MKILKEILREIELSNIKHGVMSEDDTNERISEILDDIDDEEDSIIEAYGVDGLHKIRDAEKGLYQLSRPIPELIKKTRLEAGLTQTQAAALVHGALRTWQQWEADTRDMSMANWELFIIKAGIA